MSITEFLQQPVGTLGFVVGVRKRQRNLVIQREDDGTRHWFPYEVSRYNSPLAAQDQIALQTTP